MIHAPRKCPITLCPKVKEHLNKMECLGMITHVDEPMDWVSSITYFQKANCELCLCLDPHDLNEAICHAIITRHPLWRKLLMSLHTLASSLSWMPAMDTGQSILDQDSSLLTDLQQPFWKIPCFLCNSPLAWSVPKTSSRRRWIRSLKNDRDVSELQTTSPSCKYDLVFNPQRMHVKTQAINFFGCLYNANGVHPKEVKAK